MLNEFFSGAFQKAGETVIEKIPGLALKIRITSKTRRIICVIVCVCVLLSGIGALLYYGLRFQCSFKDGVLTLEKGFLGGKMPDYLFGKPNFQKENDADAYEIIFSDFPWFSYREEITKIVLKDGITCISSAAFSDCLNLKEIYIPSSLTSIGAYAFHNCSSLEHVFLTDNVSHIGEYAFNQCHQLEEVNCNPVPVVVNGAGSIENNAFRNCGKLSHIDIPCSVTHIFGAFRNCSSLKKIKMPDSVTYIGDGTFENCSNLTQATISPNVTEIGQKTFSGCINLPKIVIPDGVIKIGDMAFSDCIELTEIEIPSSVAQIGNQAFRNCMKLREVSVPASVPNADIKSAFPSGTRVTWQSETNN